MFLIGNQPAGVKGITKELLEFIRHRVNTMGEERERFGEEYEVDNYIHEYF